MVLDSENAYQKSSFEDKYGVCLKSDSLLLLKHSRQSHSLLDYNISMFQRQQLQVAIKYFSKPVQVLNWSKRT